MTLSCTIFVVERCQEDSVWDEQNQKCVCLHCDVIDCPDGFTRVRESLGNGEAGSCCDQDICVPGK